MNARETGCRPPSAPARTPRPGDVVWRGRQNQRPLTKPQSEVTWVTIPTKPADQDDRALRNLVHAFEPGDGAEELQLWFPEQV